MNANIVTSVRDGPVVVSVVGVVGVRVTVASDAEGGDGGGQGSGESKEGWKIHGERLGSRVGEQDGAGEALLVELEIEASGLSKRMVPVFLLSFLSRWLLPLGAAQLYAIKANLISDHRLS